MSELLQTMDKGHWILCDPDMVTEIDSQWFNDKYWLNEGRLLGASSGRGSAWMVKSESYKMMLRHYYRGGLPARFNRDKYLWTGLNRTRSFKEFRLLQKMKQEGLPVPAPLAAEVKKKGLFYQANILIEYIPHKNTFAQLLNVSSHTGIWKMIGKTIADFHNKGFNHSDLNAKNILVDNDIFLIDFDNSKQMTPYESWQKGNLQRLKRSIDKLTKEPFKGENSQNWTELLNSYNSQIK